MANQSRQNVLNLPVNPDRETAYEDGLNLMRACHRIAGQRLSDLLAAAFEDLDDVLFVLAEHAGDFQRQSDFFDGMRALRLGRQVVHHSFSANMEANLDCLDGKPREPIPGVHNWDQDMDALVGDADYEERLAISAMVAKAENLAKGNLAKLDRCFAKLFDAQSRRAIQNPLAPEFITEGFYSALHELDLALSVRIVIYKHFEKEVLQRLPAMYRDVIAAISRAKAARPVGDAPKATKSAAKKSIKVGELIHDPTAFFQIDDLEESGPELKDSRKTIDDAQFLDGLLLLQSEFHEAVLRRFTDLPLRPADIHHALLRVLGEIEPGRNLRLSQSQVTALGTAGNALNDSLENGEVATTLRAALSRLQAPLARLIFAFGNENLAPAHPVARFLSALREVTQHWMASEDEFSVLHDVIVDLLQDVDDDPVIFTPHTERLARIRDLQKRRLDVDDGHHAAQLERIRQARSDAAHVILSRLRKHPNLALPVQDVLRRPWANLLVLMQLRYGKDSSQYQHSVATVDSLIQAVNGEPLGENRISHRIRLARLVKDLHVGLELVGFDDDESRKLIAALTTLQSQANKSLGAQAKQTKIEQDAEQTALANETIPGADAQADPENDALLMEAVESAQDANAGSGGTEDLAEFTRFVRNMEKGTWLQLETAEGSQRAKLSWISPISQKFLLVNRNGLKVRDLALADLADGLLNGSIEIIEDALESRHQTRRLIQEISVRRVCGIIPKSGSASSEPS